MKLRVALLPEYFYPYMGGGEEWFRHIASGLADLGHFVEVFAFPMSGVQSHESMARVQVTRAGLFVIDKWQLYFKRAVSHILTFFSHPLRNSKCDVVIGQGSALLGAFPLLWARHIPMICVVHDIYGLNDSIRDKGLMKGVARYLAVERLLHKLPFAAWIAVSEATKKKLERLGVPSTKITIVRNGIDANLLHQTPGNRRNSITYLGRLVVHKHPEDLLHALSLLDPNLKWTANIAGEGELLPELQRLARRLGLEDRVQFLGRIEENAKVKLLSSSSCVVLPSMAEGWGVVLTEAAAVGTPSIAYDIPGVHEQAELIRSIILTEPRNVKNLSTQMAELLKNPERVKALTEEGTKAAAKLTWESSTSEVYQLMARICGSVDFLSDDKRM
jgi:glycosyltransferase involved in cell wall biosynthesis